MQSRIQFGVRANEMGTNRKQRWKNRQPKTMQEALRLCLDYAQHKHNRSVARVAELMGVSECDAVAQLTRFYRGNAEAPEVMKALTLAMQDIAGHRENVRKSDAPELELFEGGEE